MHVGAARHVEASVVPLEFKTEIVEVGETVDVAVVDTHDFGTGGLSPAAHVGGDGCRIGTAEYGAYACGIVCGHGHGGRGVGLLRGSILPEVDVVDVEGLPFAAVELELSETGEVNAGECAQRQVDAAPCVGRQADCDSVVVGSGVERDGVEVYGHVAHGIEVDVDKFHVGNIDRAVVGCELESLVVEIFHAVGIVAAAFFNGGAGALALGSAGGLIIARDYNAYTWGDHQYGRVDASKLTAVATLVGNSWGVNHVPVAVDAFGNHFAVTASDNQSYVYGLNSLKDGIQNQMASDHNSQYIEKEAPAAIRKAADFSAGSDVYYYNTDVTKNEMDQVLGVALGGQHTLIQRVDGTMYAAEGIPMASWAWVLTAHWCAAIIPLWVRPLLIACRCG